MNLKSHDHRSLLGSRILVNITHSVILLQDNMRSQSIFVSKHKKGLNLTPHLKILIEKIFPLSLPRITSEEQ